MNGAFVSTLWSPPADQTTSFSGDSLTLSGGAALKLRTSVNVPTLTLQEGKLIHVGEEGSTLQLGTAANKLLVEERGTIHFEQSSATFELASALHGDGKLSLQQSRSAEDLALDGGTFILSGNNDSFLGELEATNVTIVSTHSASLGKGAVRLVNATLVPTSPINRPDLSLTLIGGDVALVLDHDLAFGEILIGTEPFPEGVYTASDLRALGFTEDNVIDGGAKLYVGSGLPESPSSFRITDISHSETGLFLAWTSEPGEIYQVEASTTGTQWDAIGAEITATGPRSTATIMMTGNISLLRIRKQ